jgi:hypothetical protein
MKSRKFQLLPISIPLLFVAQQARAFGGLSVVVLPNTRTALFVPRRQWKLRLFSSNDEEGQVVDVDDDSFLQGNDLSNRIHEIEAMGGDPFFLSDDDDDDDDGDGEDTVGRTTTESSSSSSSSTGGNFDLLSDVALSTSGGAMDILQQLNQDVKATHSDKELASASDTGSTVDPFRVNEIEEMGGDPFFLLDDEPQSGEQIDNMDDDGEVPPLELLAQMIMAVPTNNAGGATSLLQSLGGSSTDLPPMDDDDDDDSSIVDEMDDVLRQVEAAGGDASFLSQPPASQGDDHENPVDEILAMGGDPFFLSTNSDDDSGDMIDGDNEDSAFDEILAVGGDPFFLQDSEEAAAAASSSSSTTNKMKDNATPEVLDMDQDDSLSPMKMLSEIAALSASDIESGGAMNILQGIGKDEDNLNDSPDSEADRLEEIEAMGGDPFFLDLPEEEDISKETAKSKESMPVDSISLLSGRYVTDGQGPTPQIEDEKVSRDDNLEWDGTVDENAHFDL